MRARTILETLGQTTLDMIFPPRCGACGRWGAFICEDCEAELVPCHPPRCLRCWRQLNADETCERCPLEGQSLAAIRAAFVYEGVARKLVHGLKYRGLTALAGPLAMLMTRSASGTAIDADLIVPVPLAPARERSRGHNQAAELARVVSSEAGLEYDNRSLRRRGHAPPQAHAADADQRRQNVHEVFVVQAPERIAGARVLLIDDVTTTGATLCACADALLGAGAKEVYGLAFARED
jgi:ComF family protein